MSSGDHLFSANPQLDNNFAKHIVALQQSDFRSNLVHGYRFVVGDIGYLRTA